MSEHEGLMPGGLAPKSHLLVSNDFPPKVGGIQSYLWELWRRLPAESVTVLTTPYDKSAAFDAAQEFRIERTPEPVIGPYPWLKQRICSLADEVGAELILLDPAVPLGAIGPFLGRPYGVVLHGAEVTIPGRLPGSRRILKRVLADASLVVSAGSYALGEAESCVGHELPSVVVPPGVDICRFRPPSEGERLAARSRLGLAKEEVLIATVNRLVRRKGMDTLIRSVKRLQRDGHPVRLVIAGTGREAKRLEQLASELQAPVELLGRISDSDVVELYWAADIMAMLCHDRWWGLEQEGFGIVFLEAAACGLVQLAGRSGGASEAVQHGVTGLVADNPTSESEVAGLLESLVVDEDMRTRLGQAARDRAVAEFSYDLLARRLATALAREPGR